MIRQLMREQFHAHRTYLLWTTTLLTVAVAMASFATFTATQASAVEHHISAAYGLDGAWSTEISLTRSYDTRPFMTMEEVGTLVEDANDDGAGATALAQVGFITYALAPDARDAGSAAQSYPLGNPASLVGDPDWDALLLEGAAPAKGQIAVSAAWAEAADVSIGDTVWISAWDWDEDLEGDPFEVELGTLTVSALTRDPLPETYGVSAFDSLVNWDTAGDLAEQRLDATEPFVYYADITADAPTPALAALGDEVWVTHFGSPTSSLATSLAVAAGVLAFGLIGMAFTVGRSQAQARTGWVATARVLGATRSSIVAATMLEVLVVGIAAGAVGSLIGATAVAADWNRTLSSYPDAFVPDGVSLPWWAWTAMAGMSLVIAAIIGGIPAFWAARTAPAAALKPVTPVTEAQVSRNIRTWPLYATWTVTAGAFLVIYRIADYTSPEVQVEWAWTLGPFLAIAAAVVSAALVVEITRMSVAWMGRRLSASSSPWAISAGHAIVGRPRQATGPASVLAIATTVAVGVTTWAALTSFAETSSWTDDGSTAQVGPFAQMLFNFDSAVRSTWLTIFLMGYALLVAVALGAFVSLRQATSTEADASAALGLDSRESRTAAAAQFGLPLTVGVALGTALGMLGTVSVFSYWLWEPTEIDADGSATWEASTQIGPMWALTHLSHAIVAVGYVVVIGLACVAAGAAIAALTTRTSTRPLERTSA